MYMLNIRPQNHKPRTKFIHYSENHDEVAFPTFVSTHKMECMFCVNRQYDDILGNIRISNGICKHDLSFLFVFVLIYVYSIFMDFHQFQNKLICP